MDFDVVVQPGGMFGERPDVIVDLVTRDDDQRLQAQLQVRPRQ